MTEHHKVVAASAKAMAASARGVAPSASEGLVMSLPARAADGAVWLYQKTLSPALAAAFPSWGCRFHPTCSHYAREALREHGFLVGTALAAARLVRCGPWTAGGSDPVPTASKPEGRSRVPPRRPVCARIPHPGT